MGKLAERYADAARSGIYRVRDATIPRAAAAEAGMRPVEASAGELANGGCDTCTANAAGGQVVLIHDAETLAAERADEYSRLVEALHLRADGARRRGEPFFAVMIDPRGALPLPGLYKEQI